VIANTWFNECPVGLDDYDGPYPNPNLPPVVDGSDNVSTDEDIFEEALALSNYDISQFDTYNLFFLDCRSFDVLEISTPIFNHQH
jgi:hypothetical protein